MSPEEFDNRLRSSFQEEYLPPKENLWVNISEKLDQKAKKPLWHWLLPVLIAVTVCIVWLGDSLLSSGKQEQTAKTEQSTSENNLADNANPLNKDHLTENQSSQENQNPISVDSGNKTVATNGVTQNLSDIQKSDKTTLMPEKKPNSGSPYSSNRNQNTESRQSSAKRDIDKYFRSLPQMNPFEKGKTTLPVYQANEDLLTTYLRYNSFPIFKTQNINPETFAQVDFPEEKSAPTAEKKKTSSSKTTADLSSRHWVNFGIGPQLAMNSLKINNDSQAWVHRHLWDNRKKMTNNGGGLQAFAHYAYKFGKNNRFSFETGLNYSMRTENIRMNESSYDIPVRYNDGTISTYAQITLKVIIYNPITTTYDTTYYLAVDNFSIAVNNKYHAFTIPIRFNSEHKLTENTFFSIGVGGGLSMIRSQRSEHLDMRWNYIKKQGKSTQFSSSLNTTLAVYTNFNDIGQIGLYTGFQTYMNPWMVNSNQYSIRMSDAQLGITFRKPLR